MSQWAHPNAQSGPMQFFLRLILSLLIWTALQAGHFCALAQGTPPPPVLASYTFEGTAADTAGVSPPMTLTNAPLIDGALVLNGIYGPANTNGYRAAASVPGLSYNAFTFRIECKPAALSEPFVHLIGGGISNRWFGLSVEFGVLSMRLNLTNANWLFQFPGAELATNQWNQIIVSVDADTGRVAPFLNGSKLREVRLSPGFRFAVVGTAAEQAEKVFSFSNDGNAATFRGSVDNFKVHGRALSDSEVQQLLFPRLSLSKAGQSVLASWPGDLTGYRLQGSPGSWPSNHWTTLPNLPQTNNGLQVILLTPSQEKEFLRIARP